MELDNYPDLGKLKVGNGDSAGLAALRPANAITANA